MIKGLSVASLFLGMVSFVLGSLGVLTPEAVHNLGQRLANYTLSKPNSFFLKAAYYKAANPEYPSNDPKQWLNRCLIDLVVGLLTVVIGTFMTFSLPLLGLSLWGLVYSWTKPGPHPFGWGLSVAGILICISAACSLIPLKPSKTKGPSNNFGQVDPRGRPLQRPFIDGHKASNMVLNRVRLDFHHETTVMVVSKPESDSLTRCQLALYANRSLNVFW